eukprot:scaffold17691_cov99-Isochrysis_galbana.AAC.2
MNRVRGLDAVTELGSIAAAALEVSIDASFMRFQFQAAVAGPSGPISAPGDEEREPRRTRALCLPICPRQNRRRDVPECRPQSSAAGRAARAHGAAEGAMGLEAAGRSAAGLPSAGWPCRSRSGAARFAAERAERAARLLALAYGGRAVGAAAAAASRPGGRSSSISISMMLMLPVPTPRCALFSPTLPHCPALRPRSPACPPAARPRESFLG